MTSYQFNPINILDSTNATSITDGGSLTLGGGIAISKDAYIGGNVSISGTTTSFADNILLINKNPTSSSDTGIIFQRHNSDVSNSRNYAGIIYSEQNDCFNLGYLTSDVNRGSVTLDSLVPLNVKDITTTSVSSGVLASTNSTVTNSVVTNATCTSIISSNITAATLNLSSGITAGSGVLTNANIISLTTSNYIAGAQSSYALVFGGGGGSAIQSLGSNNRDVGIYSWGGYGLTIIQNTGYVGIGTTSPGVSYLGATFGNAVLSLLRGTPGSAGGASRLSLGGDNHHYTAIEGTHIGSGSTT